MGPAGVVRKHFVTGDEACAQSSHDLCGMICSAGGGIGNRAAQEVDGGIGDRAALEVDGAAAGAKAAAVARDGG